MMEAGRSADDFVGTFARGGRIAFVGGGRIDVFMGAIAGGGRSAARSDAFMGAFAEGFSPRVAALVGASAAGPIALGGGLITVPTFLPPLGGMITENSSTCSLESFLGGSKGTLAELRRLSPGSGKYECRPAFLPLLRLLLESLLAFISFSGFLSLPNL